MDRPAYIDQPRSHHLGNRDARASGSLPEVSSWPSTVLLSSLHMTSANAGVRPRMLEQSEIDANRYRHAFLARSVASRTVSEGMSANHALSFRNGG